MKFAPFFFSIMKILSRWRTAYGVGAVDYVINKGGDEGSAGEKVMCTKAVQGRSPIQTPGHVVITMGFREWSAIMASVKRYCSV